MSDEFATTHRPWEESDLSFIFSTWLRNYKYSSTGFAQEIDKETYYAHHNRVIRGLIDRGCFGVVCVDRLDPKVIYGYIVFEDTPVGRIFHYAYVKKAFRGLGLFKNLGKEAKVSFTASQYTHQTDDLKKMITKHGWTCKYNPYLMA